MSRVMGGECNSGAVVLVSQASEPLVLTPQILGLSHHRTLSLFQESDLIHLQSRIFL